MAELEDLGSQLEQLGQQIEELVRQSEVFSRRVLSAIQETSSLVATLCGHHEKVRHFYRLQTACHNLKMAVQKANRFLDQVHEISFHCSAESELMRAAKAGVAAEWNLWIAKFYTPDFRALNDLIDQLTHNMSNAECYYIEFEEACNVVISTCTEAAEMCGREVKEARNRKETTKMIGGAVTVTSIVAGTLIPGIGALAAFGTGGAVAAGTVYLVCELEQSERAFRSIRRQFDSLLGTAHSIKEEVNSVETVLVNVSGLLDSVILHRNNHKSIISVRVSLHRLNDIGSRVHQTVSSCCRSLQSKVNEL